MEQWCCGDPEVLSTARVIRSLGSEIWAPRTRLTSFQTVYLNMGKIQKNVKTCLAKRGHIHLIYTKKTKSLKQCVCLTLCLHNKSQI